MGYAWLGDRGRCTDARRKWTSIVPARRTWTSIVACLFAAIGFIRAATVCRAQTPDQYSQQRVVIPFDFESQFDGGRYGRMIGDMVWKKLERQGGFVIPESMLDVRDWCARHKMVPNPDTPLARMSQIVRGDFDAQIGIWGKVEQVDGLEWDVYDLWVNVVDFSAEPPRVLCRKKARTTTVSEIPHVYIRQALDRLSGRKPQPPAGPDLAQEQQWATQPNLVKGDFERGDDAPVGWDPLPEHVRRVTLSASDGTVNHVIRFQVSRSVAGTTGVLYYSDFFPIQEGARYRFRCRWRSTGSRAKVFIKCYDQVPTPYVGGQDSSERTGRREVYRSQQNLKGPGNRWHVHREDFTPTHTQYTPRWGRVMLYAYWPAGTVDWDDIVVKQIGPVPPVAAK